jgi:hypothetical protein
MSCMVPVNSTEASERAFEALLRRREEKMALTPIKLVSFRNKVWESGCGAMFTPKGPYPTERTDIGSFG